MFTSIVKLCLIVLFTNSCSYAAVNSRYYPYYHLAPPYGWMNDPNGFSVFRNEYHLFYQYNPDSSQGPGTAHWGHAKSTDLFNWKHLPIAMYPDQGYDKNGVFSGSALIENNKMYLFYTGNVNYPDQTPDHSNRQALASSDNGVNFTKFEWNPIISSPQYQPNIRDPKVWKNRDTYYMVLGSSFDNESRGRILLFSSKNLINWQSISILEESDGGMGFMWECPDFFVLNNKWVLLFSPQGVAAQGDNYKNLYQVGYYVGRFDYDTNLFTVETEFRELDHGHDFYATQTMLDKNGRRIFVAWSDMWEQVYPERNDGWAGQMTIPRVLTLSADMRLIQKPVAEITKIRGKLLYAGRGDSDICIEIKDNAGEISIDAPSFRDFKVVIDGGNNTAVTIFYDYVMGRISLDRGGADGLRRTRWRPKDKLQLQIFVDRSSIEVFCVDGEVTFTSRFFPQRDVVVKLSDESFANRLMIYRMQRTVPVP